MNRPPHNARIRAATVAMGLGVVAAAAWWSVQAPAAAAPGTVASEAEPAGIDRASLRSPVDNLAKRLESPAAGSPAPSGEDWALLARSYAALGRYRDADRAFDKAHSLAPRNAQLLADHAEAVLASGDPRAIERATLLVRKALDIEPLQAKALALATGPDLNGRTRR